MDKSAKRRRDESTAGTLAGDEKQLKKPNVSNANGTTTSSSSIQNSNTTRTSGPDGNATSSQGNANGLTKGSATTVSSTVNDKDAQDNNNTKEGQNLNNSSGNSNNMNTGSASAAATKSERDAASGGSGGGNNSKIAGPQNPNLLMFQRSSFLLFQPPTKTLTAQLIEQDSKGIPWDKAHDDLKKSWSEYEKDVRADFKKLYQEIEQSAVLIVENFNTKRDQDGNFDDDNEHMNDHLDIHFDQNLLSPKSQCKLKDEDNFTFPSSKLRRRWENEAFSKFGIFVQEIAQAVACDYIPPDKGAELIRYAIDYDRRTTQLKDKLGVLLSSNNSQTNDSTNRETKKDGPAETNPDNPDASTIHESDLKDSSTIALRQVLPPIFTFEQRRAILGERLSVLAALQPEYFSERQKARTKQTAIDRLYQQLVVADVLSSSQVARAVDIDSIPQVGNQMTRTGIARKKNQHRTRQNFTHTRYTLIRENMEGYCLLGILIRQVQYAAVCEPSFACRKLVDKENNLQTQNQHPKTNDSNHRMPIGGLNLSSTLIQPPVGDRNEYAPTIEGHHLPVNHDSLASDDPVKQSSDHLASIRAQSFTKVKDQLDLAGLDNEHDVTRKLANLGVNARNPTNVVTGLPRHLTVDDLIEQAYALIGQHSLDLGRVGSFITDAISEMLTYTNLSVESFLCERYRTTNAIREASRDLMMEPPFAYSDNAARRVLLALLKMLKRLVPINRITEMIQYRCTHEWRSRLMKLEESYTSLKKICDQSRKKEEEFSKKLNVKSNELKDHMATWRPNWNYDHRDGKEAKLRFERKKSQIQQELVKLSDDTMGAKMIFLRSLNDLQDHFDRILNARQSAAQTCDYNLLAYLVRMGILNDEIIYSNLPCSLWFAREDDPEKAKTHPKPDLPLIVEEFQKLDEAKYESKNQVNAITKDERKESSYENTLHHVSRIDTPFVRFLASLIAQNDWHRALGILQQIGEKVSLIGLIREELKWLLLWVLDPVLREYRLDTSFHDDFLLQGLDEVSRDAYLSQAAHTNECWETNFPRKFHGITKVGLPCDRSVEEQHGAYNNVNHHAIFASNKDEVTAYRITDKPTMVRCPVMEKRFQRFLRFADPKYGPIEEFTNTNNRQISSPGHGSDAGFHNDSSDTASPPRSLLFGGPGRGRTLQRKKSHSSIIQGGSSSPGQYQQTGSQKIKDSSDPNSECPLPVKNGIPYIGAAATTGPGIPLATLGNEPLNVSTDPTPRSHCLAQCTNILDFPDKIAPIMTFLHAGLYLEPRVHEILWELTGEYIEIVVETEKDKISYSSGNFDNHKFDGNGTPRSAYDGNSHTDSTMLHRKLEKRLRDDPVIFRFLPNHLLSTLACTCPSEEFNLRVWRTLTKLPTLLRWEVYRRWEILYERDSYIPYLPMKLIETRVKKKVINTLKRVTGKVQPGASAAQLGAEMGAPMITGGTQVRNTDNMMQYHFGRLTDANPIIVYREVADQISPSYNDNMIVPVLSMTHRISGLSADVASFVFLQECFKRAKNGPLVTEGMNVQGWLQNMSKFISLFFMKHPMSDVGTVLNEIASFVEAHASEGLNANNFGDSLMQIVVTNLISDMGGWTYVTDLSDDQLDSLSGGLKLRNEMIVSQLSGKAEDLGARDPRAPKMLVQVFQQTDVVLRFWNSLALMCKAITDNTEGAAILKSLAEEKRIVGDADGSMKIVSYLYDQAHEGLMSLTQFVGKSLSQQEYRELLPEFDSTTLALFDPAFAYTMIRPAILPYHEEGSWYELVERSEIDPSLFKAGAFDYGGSDVHNLNDNNNSISPNMSESKLNMLNDNSIENGEIKTSNSSLIPGEVSIENAIEPSFRFVFWRLELSDISLATSQYDSIIEKLQKKLDELKKDLSRLPEPNYTLHTSYRTQNYLNKKKELESVQARHKDFLSEKLAQEDRISRTYYKLSRESFLWFDSRCDGRKVCDKLVKDFFARRILLSYDDAVYCANFVYTLVESQTPGLLLLDLAEKLFEMVVYLVPSSTETEAKILGVFVCQLFKVLFEIHSNFQATSNENDEAKSLQSSRGRPILQKPSKYISSGMNSRLGGSEKQFGDRNVDSIREELRRRYLSNPMLALNYYNWNSIFRPSQGDRIVYASGSQPTENLSDMNMMEDIQVESDRDPFLGSTTVDGRIDVAVTDPNTPNSSVSVVNDNGIPIDLEYITPQNLMWALERWESFFTKRMLSYLKMSDWLEKRNALHIIARTKGTFPFTRVNGSKIAKEIGQISENEKRRDLKLLSRSLGMQVNSFQNKWKNIEGIPPANFVDEKLIKKQAEEAAAAAAAAAETEAAKSKKNSKDGDSTNRENSPVNEDCLDSNDMIVNGQSDKGTASLKRLQSNIDTQDNSLTKLKSNNINGNGLNGSGNQIQTGGSSSPIESNLNNDINCIDPVTVASPPEDSGHITVLGIADLLAQQSSMSDGENGHGDSNSSGANHDLNDRDQDMNFSNADSDKEMENVDSEVQPPISGRKRSTNLSGGNSSPGGEKRQNNRTSPSDNNIKDSNQNGRSGRPTSKDKNNADSASGTANDKKSGTTTQQNSAKKRSVSPAAVSSRKDDVNGGKRSKQ